MKQIIKYMTISLTVMLAFNACQERYVTYEAAE